MTGMRLPARLRSPSSDTVPERRSFWRRTLRAVWLLATFVALAYALWRRWPDVREAFETLDAIRVLVSTAFAVIGVGVSGQIWRELLKGLGHNLPPRGAARVFFVGQLGKYLPGSLWPVLAQMELGRDFNVAPRTSAAAVASFLWVHLVTGGMVATVALAWVEIIPAWAGFGGATLGLLLSAPLMRKALRLATRITRRAELDRYPGQRTLLSASAWGVAMWAFYGMHLSWLVPGSEAPGALGSTGAFAASWVLGFLFIIAPAGAGARETVLVGVLGQALPVGVALAIAVVSRVIMTVADGAWGAVGALMSRTTHGVVPSGDSSTETASPKDAHDRGTEDSGP